MKTITRDTIENQEILVSIIVPAYNAEDHIVDCLKAIQESDYKNYEILVVDDCSSDRTIEWIRNIPCRILNAGKRTGPAGARNLGAQHARGDMLVFVDADIVVKPTTVRRLLESFLDRVDIISVSGDYDRGSKYNNISSLYQKIYNEYKRKFLPSYGPYINTAIYCVPREALKAIGGLRSHIYTGEDYELGLRLASAGYVNYFNRSITVMHNKYVTFRELIRQKFQYATNMLMLKLELESGVNDYRIDLERTFSVAIDQILAVLLSWLTIIACVMAISLRSSAIWWMTLALFLGYCISNLRYWTFLFRAAGPIAILLLPISFLEQLVSQLSVVIGFIRFRLKLPYWKFRGIS